MTEAADIEQMPADLRRAAALLTHHAGNDRAGVNAVLDEAEELGRLRQLAYAVPSMLAALAPTWHTSSTADVMRAFTAAWADHEHRDAQ